MGKEIFETIDALMHGGDFEHKDGNTAIFIGSSPSPEQQGNDIAVLSRGCAGCTIKMLVRAMILEPKLRSILQDAVVLATLEAESERRKKASRAAEGDSVLKNVMRKDDSSMDFEGDEH